MSGSQRRRFERIKPPSDRGAMTLSTNVVASPPRLISVTRATTVSNIVSGWSTPATATSIRVTAHSWNPHARGARPRNDTTKATGATHLEQMLRRREHERAGEEKGGN